MAIPALFLESVRIEPPNGYHNSQPLVLCQVGCVIVLLKNSEVGLHSPASMGKLRPWIGSEL